MFLITFHTISSMIGLIDEDIEETIDYENIHADPMPPITH